MNTERTTKKLPFLIQRLHRTPKNQHQKGIDKYFAFEYMGSAEFEFGILFRALKAMREADVEGPHRIKIEGKYIAWYVGSAKDIGVATEVFEDQLGPRELSLKERTEILRAYKKSDAWVETTAWWAVDQPVPWLLFMKKDDAALWFKLLKEKT